MSSSPRLKAGEDQYPKSNTVKQRERILSYSDFYFIRAVNRLDEAHPHWGGQSALLNLPIQMLVLSKSTLTDSMRAPHSPAKLSHKINHHGAPLICSYITMQNGIKTKKNESTTGTSSNQ